ncbi:hypothetical protein I3842_04G129500 [Carya illinoinensis]|uniref:Retrovirus-related Pol polyprotein from transposon TNT 1-94-like beta-barrel domain-containing protein n=1 Tax=Carya illinoinensis TaxID=32201 RepID=A0A922JUW9_CARIL|nr:hypothetical protein I3842_04G129500 [Carya illinoinensis]
MVIIRNDLSISAYFTQMKGLWDELLNYRPLPVCSCGGLRSLMDMHQQDYVMRFLMGLNDSYSHVTGQILLIEPLPPINKRDIGSVLVPSIPSTAFASTTKSAPMAKPSTRRPFCSHCSIPGHTVEKCFKLHGYPPGYRSKGKSSNYASTSNSHPSVNTAHHVANSTLTPSMPFTPQQCQQLLALLHPESSDSPPPTANPVTSPLDQLSSKSSISSIFSLNTANPTSNLHNEWVIDTGATDHMVHSISLFQSFKPVHNSFVKLPNGFSAPVTHVGSVRLLPQLVLHNVLCIPPFHFNLLSVSQLTKSSPCCINFFHDSCIIQDLIHWEMIGKGKAKEGLYLLQLPDLPVKCSKDLSSNSVLALHSSHLLFDVWHKRLGYPSLPRMQL